MIDSEESCGPVRLWLGLRVVPVGFRGDRDQCPVQDHVGVPGLLLVLDRRAELRRPGASRATISFTYLQAVVTIAPNPAVSSANVSPLRR